MQELEWFVFLSSTGNFVGGCNFCFFKKCQCLQKRNEFPKFIAPRILHALTVHAIIAYPYALCREHAGPSYNGPQAVTPQQTHDVLLMTGFASCEPRWKQTN